MSLLPTSKWMRALPCRQWKRTLHEKLASPIPTPLPYIIRGTPRSRPPGNTKTHASVSISTCLETQRIARCRLNRNPCSIDLNLPRRLHLRFFNADSDQAENFDWKISVATLSSSHPNNHVCVTLSCSSIENSADSPPFHTVISSRKPRVHPALYNPLRSTLSALDNPNEF